MQPLLQWEKHSVLNSLCVCVFVALGTQHSMRIRPYFHLWPVPLHNILPQNPINCAIFGRKKKGKVSEHKMCVLSFSTTFTCNISHSKNN